MSGYHSAQTTVGTTATLVATISSAPDVDGVLVSSSARRSFGRAAGQAAFGVGAWAPGRAGVGADDDGERRRLNGELSVRLRRWDSPPR